MCGVAGCVARPGESPDLEALGRMAAALHHRGPDDHGVVAVGEVGLAHTRLSIVDPSPAGHQPMSDEDGRWYLAYNGEIFNHEQLRAGQRSTGYRSGTDTESLLRALIADGEEAIGRCNGLFAYAALDTARRKLLLVRDRFGVKPLYVAEHDGRIWFASEARALLAAGIPSQVDSAALHYAVFGGYLTGPVQWLGAVRQVLPGEVMTIDLTTRRITTRSWYAPADAVDPELARALSKESRTGLRERLETTLRESVRRRLMSDVPLGTMCSGGLDSSLVTAFARDEQPTIRAYNASVADQPEADEGPWAERVADALGVELRTVAMSAETWRDGFVAAAIHNEQPLVHESSIPMAAIAELAHRDGVKVLLSGEGADELMGGYGFRHGREYRDLDRLRPGERTLRAAYRELQRRRTLRAGGGDVLPAEYARLLGVYQRSWRAYRHHHGLRRRLEVALLCDLRTYLPHLLNRQDKNTMQQSIETRVPFLDPDVIALTVNLPLESRVLPERKGILRELGAIHLPAEVASRPKVGFGFNTDRYLQPAERPGFLADGRLREELRIPASEWAARVDTMTGQRRMLALSAEVLLRAFVDRASTASISQELWRQHA